MSLPVGTVTFFRSDIEGSMEHVQALGSRYDELNAEHARLVRDRVEADGGEVVRTEGDAFFAVFTDAVAAARTAVSVQRAMAEHSWPEGRPFRLRIGLHTGAAVRAGDDYGGFEVNRAARIAALGHGGQIVVSDAARALIAADLDGWEVIDLGRHRLKGIAEPEAVFGLVAPGLEREFEPLRDPVAATEHLPERVTSLVGRERELDELGRLLSDTRLLTLTGPGGTGKTTLAVELARRHAADHADGAWFIDLQAVTDPALVRAEIAHGVGLRDGPMGSAVDRMDAYLADRELLIVLDNFEQVVDAADDVRRLLAATPRSRVIVSSRIALRLSSEQEFPVRPLGLEGDADAEAVRLFVDRARRIRPSLALDADAMRAIETTCRLVDGLPLAIELCAARVSVLPLDRIPERLGQQLPLPGTGPRDLPARQRTIEDTVAWSCDLLDEGTARLFTALGVFGETFELEQAEAVCGPVLGPDVDTLDGLARLVDESLVMRLDDEVGGIRFGMLVPIRAYARARLADDDRRHELQELHARTFIDLADRYLPDHGSPTSAEWLDRLEADDDNIRLAATRAIEAGATAMALELVGRLWRYWVHSGRIADAREHIRGALRLPGADEPSEARAWALAAAGSIGYWSNDWDQAASMYRQQLALAEAHGYALAEADACLSLVFVDRSHGREPEAVEMADRARAILTRGDHRVRLGELEIALILTAGPRILAEPDVMVPRVEAQLEVLADSPSEVVRRATPVVRAMILLARGEPILALRQYVANARESLRWREMGDLIPSLSFICAVGMGMLPPETTTSLLAAVEAASERYGISGPPWPMLLGDPDAPEPKTTMRARLGDATFEPAWEAGRRLSLNEALDLLEGFVEQAEQTEQAAPSPPAGS